MNRKSRNRLFHVIVLGGVGLTANLVACGGDTEPSEFDAGDSAGADGFPSEGPALDAFPREGAGDTGSHEDDASDASDASPDGPCFPIETAISPDC